MNHSKKIEFSKPNRFFSYFIFTLGALFYLYEYCLQVSPGIMGKEIMAYFHINAATLGTVIGAYYYTYTLMQIPAGMLYDYYGAGKTMSLAILLCALGTSIFALSGHIYLSVLGRMLMGAGSAFAFVGALYIALHWFPHRYFAILAGVVQLLGSLGAIFGEAPLAALVKTISWQTTLLMMGITGVALACCVYLFIKESPHKLKKRKSKRIKITYFINNLKIILKKSQTWVIALYAFCIWAPISTFSVLWGVPFLVEKYHITTFAAAEACSMTWLGVALGSPFIGWWSNRLHIRNFPLWLFPAIGFFALTTVIYVPNLPIAFIYLGLFLIGLAAAGQSLSFAVISEINKSHHTSTAIGFNNMAIVFSGAVLQPFVGWLLDLNSDGTLLNGALVYSAYDYQVALSVLPICFLTSFIVAKFFINETHAEIINQDNNTRQPSTPKRPDQTSGSQD